ncbi:transposase [Paracoccus sp. WLY502]|uniref:transposase n=1 Tax=Paracoccus yibinensis TaxID=3068891 RepID=UPI0027969B22|nr:transposase [Paracoccus sp. WLY502]MDQ1901620.1 transposase [Paracoccus sp. WLY502]
MATLISGNVRPVAGDLVLARVDVLGKQTKLELTDGRRAHMFPDDEIIVSYGNRYAPDQFEAIVGDDLAPCDLVAAGGVAGVELSRHARMLPPTRITPVGLIGDAMGRRLNLAQFRIDASDRTPDMPVVLSLGTSMNAGKTLTSTSLVRGFKRLGLRVAALKITGTGAGGDMWIVRDAGADVALDFTDAGFASTYLTPVDDIVKGAFCLINAAAQSGCQVAVIEIADGLQQKETAQLIRNDALCALSLGCTFAAYDAMGAIGGCHELAEAGHTVFGISGRLGLSPLAVREAEAATGLRFYSPWDLQNSALVPQIRRRAVQVFAASRFQRHSLLALTREAMSHDPMEAADGTGREDQAASQPLSGASAQQAREILATVAKHLMNLEVATHCGMRPDEAHAPCRTNRRNGFRRLRWASNLGNIELRVPRLRHGYYTPSFLGAKIAPAQVEAVLHAADAAACEEALQDVLTSVGGPGINRADAAPIVASLMTLLGKPALPVVDGQGSDPAQPINGSVFQSRNLWPEDEEANPDQSDVEDEEDPGFADEIAREPSIAEATAGVNVLAMAPPH